MPTVQVVGSSSTLPHVADDTAFLARTLQHRNRYGSRYRLEDGREQLVVSTRPQNYVDRDGSWRPIAPRLRGSSADGFEREVSGTPFRAWFDVDGGTYRFAPGVSGDGWVEFDVPVPQGADGVVRGTTSLEYAGEHERTKLDVLTDRVKGSFLLEDRLAATSWTVPIRTGGGLRVRDDLVVVDETGRGVAEIVEPFAIDAAGTEVDMPWRLEGGALHFELDTTGLEYPIVVDPTITEGLGAGANDARVNGDANGSPVDCDSLSPGLAIHRHGYIAGPVYYDGIYRFPAVSLPRGAQVSAANFDLQFDWAQSQPDNTNTIWIATLRIEQADNSAAFSGCAGVLGRSWTLGGGLQFLNSPDRYRWTVPTLAEGVAARAGWAPGNAVTLYTDSAGPQGNGGYYGAASAYENTTMANPVWTITYTDDVTAPNAPSAARDGTSTTSDVDWMTSLTTLSANWNAATDNSGGSGIRDYDYCISTATSCTGTILVGWTATTSTSFTRTGLTLTENQVYYTCVRAVDYSDNVSALRCTDGQRADMTAPTAPTSRLDGGTQGTDVAWSSSLTSLSGNWSGASDGAGSGILNYDTCFSTSSTGSDCASTAVAPDAIDTVSPHTRSTLTLTAGTLYYFCVRARDNVNRISSRVCSNGQRVDSTAPSMPAATRDGSTAGTDIDWQTSTTTLAANWDAGADAESGVLEYSWCFATATACGGTVLASGTTTSLTASATGLTLATATPYYSCVRTRNAALTYSSYRCSDAVQLDQTNPTASTTVNDGTGADIAITYDGTSISANWTASTDSQSGIARYDTCFSTTAPCAGTIVSGWTTAGLSLSATRSVTLTNNATYFACVRAVDGVGNVGGVTCSNGQQYIGDTTNPPAPAWVNDGPGVDIAWNTTTNTIAANWASVTDAGGSGLNRYEYCMSTLATCAGTVVASWTSTGLTTSVSRGSLALTQGTTYYVCVRAVDGAGNIGTATCSNGQRVDSVVSAPSPVNDGTGADAAWVTSTTTLSANWGAVSDGVSGLNRYEYCFSTSATCAGTVVANWTSAATATSVTRNSLALVDGQAYVACIRAYDNAGNSATTCSNGQTVDVTPPGIPASVADGTGADIAWTSSLTQMSANWPAATDATSGIARYEYCISTTTGCAGTIVRTWTSAGASTSVTASSLSLVNGTQYFVCVRTVDGAGWTSSSSRCSNGQRVDSTLPSAPTLVTPAAAAVLTASPSFTATYVDPAPASPGQLSFELCSDSACSTVVDSGTSATGIATGSNGSWTPAVLSGGSYWWRASGTDSAGNAGPWSATRAFTLTYAPTAPTLISPADTAWVNTGTPALTARFNDPDVGATGQLTFEVCATNAADPWSANCASGYQTGLSAAGIANGANGNWSTAAIPNAATRYWRARGNDGTSTSPWSVVRSVRIDTNPPPAVTTLAAPSPTSTVPSMTWTTVTDAESGTAYYRVYRSAISGVLGSQVNANGATTTGSFTDSALSSSGTYYYTVRAVDAVGNERTTGNNQVQVAYIAPLYFRDTNSLGSGSGAWLLSYNAGTSANTATSPRIANGTGTIQFKAGISEGSADYQALPAQPRGNGWLLDASQGAAFSAGTWRFWVTSNAQRTHTGYVNVNAWKVTLSGGVIQAGATQLTQSGWTEGTTNVGSTTSNQTHFVDVPMNQVSFAAGEYLYVELWERVTGSSGNNTTNVDLQVDTSAERIEPTAPPPLGPAINDAQAGDDTWRNTNSGLYDIDFSDATALSNFQTNVWSAPGQTGTQRQAWTQVAALAGTTYTTDWSLLGSTWSAMAEGVNYVTVRVTNSAAQQTTVIDAFYVNKDTVAPPAVTTLAGTTPTLAAPALTWTTVTDATSGVAHYNVYRGPSSTGPWTKVSTDGAVTTGAFTDAAATVGQTHWYKVQAVDQATNEATASNVVSVLYHRAPATPTLVSPASGATGVALAPTLSAGYSDADAHSGTVSFQVCSDSACTSVVRSGSSGATASGTNATWATTPALASNTTYWYRAMATDAIGATSAWTSTRSFTTAAAPSVIDNQAGDLTWRSSNSGTYDVDFTDGTALANFETNVWSGAGQGGTQRQAWTQVAAVSGTSYTTNWALLASTWTAMAQGINYVSVRVTNTSALTSTVVDTFEVRKDTVAPPAVTTLAATSPTVAAPALGWTTVTDATSGVDYYRVYSAPSSTGPWMQVSTDGAPTTGSYADASAPVDATQWYKVQAVDLAGLEAAASNVVSVYYHRTPDAPTLVSPANGVTGTSPLPALSATHVDADAHTGTITFEVCSDSSCAAVVRTGTSAAGIASGSTGSWTVPAALAPGTQYWWRARSADQHGAASAYSAIRTFTTSTGPTITDNQAGDATWRSTNSGTYDVDYSDPLGLDRFEVQVWSDAAQTGAMLQNWTQVAGPLAGTSYTTNWSLPASTWAAMAEGVNYVSVRAFNDASGTSTLVDAFTVAKDVSATAPGTVNDGPAADVDWWPSTSTLDINWTDTTGETGLSGVLRYEYCIATLAGCAGTVARTWTNAGTGTSLTALTLSLTNGSLYVVALRTVDNAGNTSTANSSDSFRVDATAPTAPTLVTPAASATVTALPTFTATYTDPAPASSGQLTFEACTDAVCSTVVDSGTSASSIAPTANGSWTPASLAGGSYWWRARGTDSAGTTGPWSTTRAFVLSYPPTAPTLVSPADTAWVNTATPTLTARFNDPEATATGQLTFETCATSAADPWSANCASGYQAGTSAAGIAEGANGTWAPGAIPNGSTRYWRVRGNDGVSNGPWSVTRSVRIDTNPPPAVTTLTAPSPTTAAPVLNWTTVTDAESGTAFYRVYRSSAAGVLGAQVNTDGDATTGSWVDTTGVASGTWYYTVHAVDTVGNERTTGNGQVTVSYVAPMYLRANPAGTLGTGWTIEPTAGTFADSDTSPKIGQGSGYVRLDPGLAPNSPTFVGTLPSTPSGSGWIHEQVAGTGHVAGTWRFHVSTSTTRTHQGYIVVRAWKVTTVAGALSTSTPLSGWVQGATNVGAVTSLQSHYIDVPMSQVTFGAGEHLYVEYWENVTVPASGGGSTNTTVTFQVDTSAERIEPTGPIPPVTVASTSPTSLPQGRRDAVVRINGTGFQNGATVAFSGTGISIDSTSWVSATAIDVTVDVAAAATLGARNITVTNPDASAATGSGVFTVTAPTISLGFSTLGFADAARDNSAPFDLAFGLVTPGTSREIGTAGSGQAIAGEAIAASVTSDTDFVLQVTGADWTDGAAGTMPASALALKHNGVAEAWIPLSTSAITTDGPTAPSTTTFSHDLRLTVPGGQAAGAFSTTVTYTAIAAP